MTMPTPASWHVLGDGITQGTDLKPNGTGLQDYYQIPYQIDSGPAMGHQGTVKVPALPGWEQQVAPAIQAAVNATHSVAGLTG